MIKLTKEQAEWLIEMIMKSRREQLFGRNAYHEETILKVINQCTEKEFPACSFETQQHRIISLHQCVDKAVLNQDIFLEKEELMHLVLSIEEIIDWMEEQE